MVALRRSLSFAASALLLVTVAVACTQRPDPAPPQGASGGWTLSTIGFLTEDPVASIDGATWLGDRWVAFGRLQRKAGNTVTAAVWTSPDGVAWTAHELPGRDDPAGTTEGRVTSVVASGTGGGFLAVGSVGIGARSIPAVWPTADLEDWGTAVEIARPERVGGLQINGVAWFRDRYLAVGGPAAGTDGGRPFLWTSTDAQSWLTSDATFGEDAAGGGGRPTTLAGVVVVGDRAVAISTGEGALHAWTTSDGTSFSGRVVVPGSGGRTPVRAAGIALADPGAVVAAQDAEGRAIRASSTDGSSWSSAAPVPMQPSSLAAVGREATIVGTASERVWRAAAGGPAAAVDLPEASPLRSPARAPLDGLAPRIASHDGATLLLVPAERGWQAWRTDAGADGPFRRTDVDTLPHTGRVPSDHVAGIAGNDAQLLAVGRRSYAVEGGTPRDEGRIWASTDGRSWAEAHLSDAVASMAAVTNFNSGFVAVGHRAPNGDGHVRPVVVINEKPGVYSTSLPDGDELPVGEGASLVPVELVRRDSVLVMTAFEVADSDLPGDAGVEATARARGVLRAFTSPDGILWAPIALSAFEARPGAAQGAGVAAGVGAACVVGDQASILAGPGPDFYAVGSEGTASAQRRTPTGDPASWPRPMACTRHGDGGMSVLGDGPDGTAVVSLTATAAGSDGAGADATPPDPTTLPAPADVWLSARALARGDGFWLAAAAGRRSGPATVAGCTSPRVWTSGDARQWGPQLPAEALLRGTGCGATTAAVRWRGSWVVAATVADAAVVVRGP